MSLVELGKQLLEAAKHGMTDEVRALMSNGAPFTTDWLGTSPLHFAAQYGQIETVEVLLRAGLSRDARTKVDRTPLHFAAQEGHLEVVNLLITNGADIEAKDMLKMTPLHWAVEKGHADIVQLLITHGSSTNGQNKFEKTPVDIAISNGRADLVELLQYSSQNVMEINADSTVVEEVTTTSDGANNLGLMTTFSAEDLAGDGSNDESTYSVPVSIASLKGIKIVKSRPSSDEPSETNSTAVLATLAALAEARSSNNVDKTASADALSWLETHGITMISSGDNANIVTDLIRRQCEHCDGEAGKLALKKAQEQGLEMAAEDSDSDKNPLTKYVTIVSGETQFQLSSDIAESSTPTSISSRAGNLIIKTEPFTLDLSDSEEIRDSEDLRRQLREVQRQAEEYKNQLKRKEQEAEVYKKQLTQITVSKLS